MLCKLVIWFEIQFIIAISLEKGLLSKFLLILMETLLMIMIVTHMYFTETLNFIQIKQLDITEELDKKCHQIHTVLTLKTVAVHKQNYVMDHKLPVLFNHLYRFGKSYYFGSIWISHQHYLLQLFHLVKDILIFSFPILINQYLVQQQFIMC